MARWVVVVVVPHNIQHHTNAQTFVSRDGRQVSYLRLSRAAAVAFASAVRVCVFAVRRSVILNSIHTHTTFAYPPIRPPCPPPKMRGVHACQRKHIPSRRPVAYVSMALRRHCDGDGSNGNGYTADAGTEPCKRRRAFSCIQARVLRWSGGLVLFITGELLHTHTRGRRAGRQSERGCVCE